MSDKLDLEKAKKKALAKHFKKAAAHHEGHAQDDEKCQMAHKAHADHHEAKMGKADDPQHDYHKACAAFHKSMSSFAEKMGKRETEYAEHNKAMAAATEEDDAADAKDAKDAKDKKKTKDDAKKAAFATLDIEFEPETDEPGDSTMTNVASDVVAKAVADKAAAEAKTAADKVAAEAAAAATTTTDAGDPADLQKALQAGLRDAVKNGLAEILNTPEFKKTMQEQLANALLEQLGQQTAAAPVKTFAVPRTIDINKITIASGGTPTLESAGTVDPAFADLVSMGN